jgi:hypothetical protein
MSPLRNPCREHHLQLKRRLESVKRIHRQRRARARIDELERQHESVAAQIAALRRRRR